MNRRLFLSLITIPVIAKLLPVQTEIEHWSDCGLHDRPQRACDCFHVGARIEQHANPELKATVTAITDKGVMLSFDNPVKEGFLSINGGEIPTSAFQYWRRI